MNLNLQVCNPNITWGDSLRVSLQERGISRTTPADLWVAMQAPKGKFLYFTGNSARPLSTEPQVFIKQVGVGANNHSLLNIKIPDTIAIGTYTFYVLYNEVDADLTELSLTLRSNIAKATTIVLE